MLLKRTITLELEHPDDDTAQRIVAILLEKHAAGLRLGTVGNAPTGRQIYREGTVSWKAEPAEDAAPHGLAHRGE